MAEHESAHFPEHCNHLTRRAALHGAASVGALALPAGAAIAVLPAGAAMAFEQIDAELRVCMDAWQDISDFPRCDPWRRGLFERAATIEITSQADAAAALRVLLRWGCVCDESGLNGLESREAMMSGIGYPEEARLVNIIQNVRRFLAGEQQQLAGEA